MNNLPEQKIAFQNTDKKKVVATKGLKLKNKEAEKREQEKREKEEYMRKFNADAEKTIQHQEESSNRAVTVITRYLKMSEDKTLAQNKHKIAQDVEREIRQDLIQLALDLNNDETEEDNGKGSVVVLSVMTKILMLYRDRINNLEYQLQHDCSLRRDNR